MRTLQWHEMVWSGKGISLWLIWAFWGLAVQASAEQHLSIRHYQQNPWLAGLKSGIHFNSPTEGWVGGYEIRSRREPVLPYLLKTTRGPEYLEPVNTLDLPPGYYLTSLFFLDRQVGWVLMSREDDSEKRLFHTEDGGSRWEELSHNLPFGYLSGKIQFVSSAVGWSLGWETVWRTDTGGKTWRKLEIPNASGGHSDYHDLFFLNPMQGWIGGDGVIAHTADGGETWTLQYDISREVTPAFQSVHFLSAREGWVAGGWLLLRTVDGGRTWKDIHIIKNTIEGSEYTFCGVYFLSSDVGVVTGQYWQYRTSTYERPFLLVTFDGGDTWIYYDLPIPIDTFSQVGSTLFGVYTSSGIPDAPGILEIQFEQ